MDPRENTLTQFAPAESDQAPLYRILFLEDNPDDVELILHELSLSGLKVAYTRIDKKKEFLKTVLRFEPHIILGDYSLSSFNGVEAFHMLKEANLEVPFILVTGVLSEQMALQCLKDGIDDFVLKSNFKRLPQAIISAIEKRKTEQEKAQMALELKRSHKELLLLLNRHQVSVEEERMNIARDLHDELGQVLTALKIDIMMLWKRIGAGKMTKESVDSEFEGVAGMLDKITRSVKDISSGLRPETLDDLGFLEAVKVHASEFERRSKIQCKTTLPARDLEINKDLSIALFRIIQEALTNVARHSQASSAEIKLGVADGRIHMSIEDNGKGIMESDVNSSHSLGIIGLRERVKLLHGEFKIGSMKKGGTALLVDVPLIN